MVRKVRDYGTKDEGFPVIVTGIWHVADVGVKVCRRYVNIDKYG